MVLLASQKTFLFLCNFFLDKLLWMFCGNRYR